MHTNQISSKPSSCRYLLMRHAEPRMQRHTNGLQQAHTLACAHSLGVIRGDTSFCSLTCGPLPACCAACTRRFIYSRDTNFGLCLSGMDNNHGRSAACLGVLRNHDPGDCLLYQLHKPGLWPSASSFLIIYEEVFFFRFACFWG